MSEQKLSRVVQSIPPCLSGIIIRLTIDLHPILRSTSIEHSKEQTLQIAGFRH